MSFEVHVLLRCTLVRLHPNKARLVLRPPSHPLVDFCKKVDREVECLPHDGYHTLLA
jgi:hypothetical protein